LGFLVLADEVRSGDAPGFDEWLLRAARDPDNPSRLAGPPALEEASRDLTALGGVTVLCLVTAGVVGYLLLAGKHHAVLLVLAATLGGLLLSALFKRLYDRPRPQVVPHLSHVSTASFPSGHSMLSAVVYLTLGALLARFAKRPALKVYFVALAL